MLNIQGQLQHYVNQIFLAWSELQIRFVKLTSIDSTCVISSPNPMFDHLLESSRWDDSNEWSNIGFGEEIAIIENKKRSLSGALAKYHSGPNTLVSLPNSNRPVHSSVIPSHLFGHPSTRAVFIWSSSNFLKMFVVVRYWPSSIMSQIAQVIKVLRSYAHFCFWMFVEM